MGSVRNSNNVRTNRTVRQSTEHPGVMKIYITILCISFLQGLQFAPSPVLRQISEHYPGVSTSLIQMLITGPSLVGVFCALGSGVLVTRISKKQLLLFSSLISAVSGLVPLLADSFPLLLGCRLVYGFALGLATALNTAVVAEWFEGEARVRAMGFQAASVGAGMAVTTAGAGFLGASVFTNSYFIHSIGIISFLLILLCLPETGLAVPSEGNRIRINRRVVIIAVLAFLEMLFLITFTTNISMHLSGALAGDTKASGYLTSIFSIGQIIIGLILSYLTRILKKASLPAAMASFTLGAVILILFPSTFPMLCLGAVFCGFSQGVFIPTAMVEAANAVPPIAAAMASGVLTCGTCSGQLVSPVILNSVVRLLFGEVTTTGVYTVAAVGMALSAVFCAFVMMRGEKK